MILFLAHYIVHIHISIIAIFIIFLSAVDIHLRGQATHDRTIT